MVLLEVKNLKTYYKTKKGQVKAVDDISFKLKKGEVLGLVGESGCGKTTASLSIMRMLPKAGQIIDGEILYENIQDIKQEKQARQNKNVLFSFLSKNIKKLFVFVTKKNKDNTSDENKQGEDINNNLLALSETEMLTVRGNHIAMIFQGSMNALNPVHRIGKQLKEVIDIHEPEVDDETARNRVLDILKAVGIDPQRVDDYPHQLSGGMQQRALIAMALIGNPKVLIADEPVTALDVIVQAQVLKVTRQIQQEFNLSMIMITHDLSVIAEVCDTLAIMYAGKIVEYGDLRTLFKEPKHPYTKALINAFPSVVGPKKDLHKIEGIPPDLTNPPSGCRFHPRCPERMPICDKRVPSNTPTETGYVACYLYEDFTIEDLEGDDNDK